MLLNAQSRQAMHVELPSLDIHRSQGDKMNF
jgi:hypothetical protein